MCQFLIRLACCIATNKAHVQKLHRTGINLSQAVFSMDNYMSQCLEYFPIKNLKVQITSKGATTINVVWR